MHTQEYVERVMEVMKETNNLLAKEEGARSYVETSVRNKIKTGSIIDSLVGDQERFRIKLKTENRRVSDIDPGMNKHIEDVLSSFTSSMSRANIDAKEKNLLKREIVKSLKGDLKISEDVSIFFEELDKAVKLQKGSSIVKGLRKIIRFSSQCDITEYEKRHMKLLLERVDETVAYKSKIDQASLVGGSFYLSADPVDFLTMSTNNSNWTSCYSVAKDRPDSHSAGGQESSAVSLGVGQDSMLIYIEDDKNKMGKDKSKLLRAILYINRDVFSIGYFYPYEIAEDTVNALGREIAELLYEKTGIIYTEVEKDISLATFPEYDGIYCDIYENHTPRTVYSSREIKNSWVDVRPFGEGVCLSCGCSDISDTIYCEECRGYRYCYECSSYEPLSLFEGKSEICIGCEGYDEHDSYWDDSEEDY